MKHQFFKIALSLSFCAAAALPAAGDVLNDALECEQFLVMSAGHSAAWL
ncbi:hypothetical protein [Henriciella sp.]|nr:hypothetical protein [Henriciella sp.]